jgi:hypothetical protein
MIPTSYPSVAAVAAATKTSFCSDRLGDAEDGDGGGGGDVVAVEN